MKVYLDDIRPTPEGFIRCYTPTEVIALLQTGQVTLVSLDHDLGLQDNGREITGNDVVLWIEEQVVLHHMTPPEIVVHSDNPSGIDKMRRGIQQIQRLHQRNCEHKG